MLSTSLLPAAGTLLRNTSRSVAAPNTFNILGRNFSSGGIGVNFGRVSKENVVTLHGRPAKPDDLVSITGGIRKGINAKILSETLKQFRIMY